jgi:hypothetical protein
MGEGTEGAADFSRVHPASWKSSTPPAALTRLVTSSTISRLSGSLPSTTSHQQLACALWFAKSSPGTSPSCTSTRTIPPPLPLLPLLLSPLLPPLLSAPSAVPLSFPSPSAATSTGTGRLWPRDQKTE